MTTDAPALRFLQGTTSGLSEAYRALRTSVLLSSAVRAPHTILNYQRQRR